MSTFIFASSLLLCFLVYRSNGSIHDKVSYHEVIPSTEAHMRTRRNVVKGPVSDLLEKDFTFTAFNRTFNCHLMPRTNFFSPSFKLKVYGANGVAREHKFRRDSIFVGSCDGDPNSEIRGYFKGALFTGSLTYDGVMYGLEDATRHLTIPISSSTGFQEHMIMYRTSDMKWDQQPEHDGHGPSFCGNVHAKGTSREPNSPETVVDSVVPEDHKTSHRRKRATVPNLNTCRIVAVADFKFFRNTGNSDIYDTALYISGVMDVVDNIYRKTHWNAGSSVTGMGIEIAEMRVYGAPTTGFNKDVGSWMPINLLESFSNDTSLSEFCAAHLFTHQGFRGNVLGLAYIAPARSGGLGGICSPVSFIEGLELSLNTGWSSTSNSNGERILMQQSNLVTAHELGHNWGSEHDPESGRCAPSGYFDDGKYLMYPYSVAGYDSNNYEFSSCSQAYIGQVLAVKGPSCLKQRSYDDNLVCGNGRIDAGEACDAGFLGRFNLDKCCDNQCQFVSGATCSPVNSECCTDCEASPVGRVCRGETGVDCQDTAYCTGTSLECPRGQNKTDGTTCLDEGQCRTGICFPFCEYRGLVSCACDRLETSCLRCCRTQAGAECLPHSDNKTLPDDRPCVGGYCELGVCQAGSVSTVQRLFDILENISVDNIVKFFRDNMVGTVMVFSLMLWIPLSVIISCLDHRKRNNLDRSENIDLRMDRNLLYDEDKRKVEFTASPSDRTRGTTSPRYRNANFTDLGGFGSDTHSIRS